MDYKDTALEVIAKVSGIERDKITPEMELVADLGINSPKALELLVELEDGLGIEIGDEDAASMNTVADILGFVKRLSAGAS
jgi:acyl carrier protein